MIACTCRSLFRRIVELAGTFTNTYVISNPLQYLQKRRLCYGLNYNWKMEGRRVVRGGMDHKKQKVTNPVWRPVATQSSSYEECLVKDAKGDLENSCDLDDIAKPEVGSQIEEVQGSISISFVQRTDHKHSISLEAGASMMRFIKGKGGSTQKEIEEETGVRIIFPSSRKDDSLIIEGISAESVCRASKRIQVIIDEAVKSPTLDYSHFISLPLAIHPELVDKLVNFQNSILGIKDPNQDENRDSDSNGDTSDEEDKDLHSDTAHHVAVELKAETVNEHANVDITNIPIVNYPPKESKSSALGSKISILSELGIEKSIFIKPKTFHLTVLMLKLWNKERVATAAAVLQAVSSEVMDALDSRSVSVKLKGLDCMRGSLAKARVLYAPVTEIGGEGRLLRACEVIIDAFVKAGLVLEKDAQQKLKLHATVMNARHRERKSRTRKIDFFDARGIVNQYGSEEWGLYLIREAHLSQRFVFDENGYYHCCTSIPFPGEMQVD